MVRDGGRPGCFRRQDTRDRAPPACRALDRDGSISAVIAAHLVFVVPYVFLTLGDPYRSLDPRYGRIAAALRTSPWPVFWRIRVPLLPPSLATSVAVGFAVSLGQYLATL